MTNLAARSSLFLILWCIISNGRLGSLGVGLVTGVLAGWISVRLLPPSSGFLHLWSAASMILRLGVGSIVAGLDVALRALRQPVDVRPGIVNVPLSLEPGMGRNLFLLLQSIQPGTLPAGYEAAQLSLHCLDTSLTVVERFAADEAEFRGAITHD
jgi:multicomponent Na+:H+ antiporter subunit E